MFFKTKMIRIKKKKNNKTKKVIKGGRSKAKVEHDREISGRQIKDLPDVTNDGEAIMACSPIIKGNQVVNKSCYTHNTLKIIKKFYNKKNPKDKIKTNDPIELWKTLKTRLVECDGEKERCWLNVVDDPKIRMKING